VEACLHPYTGLCDATASRQIFLQKVCGIRRLTSVHEKTTGAADDGILETLGKFREVMSLPSNTNIPFSSPLSK
jgi:hypothetical protein